MKVSNLFRSIAVALALFALGMPAQAGMLTTIEMQNQPVEAATSTVGAQRDWIEAQLQRGGVDQAEASLRVAAMTDAEVAGLYQQIDQAPAGGADWLVIALVIFIVLEVTGYIDVIPEK